MNGNSLLLDHNTYGNMHLRGQLVEEQSMGCTTSRTFHTVCGLLKRSNCIGQAVAQARDKDGRTM